MASDIHAHPVDLLRLFPGAEAERRSLGIACAASAWNGEDFSRHEEMAAAARTDGAAPLFPCFALHPQLPAYMIAREKSPAETAAATVMSVGDFRDKLDLLEDLAARGRLAAVGETGFDLYSAEFRETEAIQDDLFAAHLETALRHDLPLILHVRRAMHKIFPHTKALKALPAAVFHSWPGSPDEGFSLLRRGIRAFFSFGAAILHNHKNAVLSCTALPAEQILLETDAPYQPLRGREFSSWADLSVILRSAAAIRKESGKPGGEPEELENITDGNFFSILMRAQ
ncbi:MAG: TatD family hydrolase [Spirochaetaceae bacterium]|jgi:TatD DNase family protein|nr:TatD family hydrolase [Spirochaetaceae bacterium]